MRKLFMMLTACLLPGMLMAETLIIKDFKYSQPLRLHDFVAIGDTAGMAPVADAIDLTVSVDNLKFDASLPNVVEQSMIMMEANFENRGFVETEIKVDSITDYILYIDGKKVQTGANLNLRPATHQAMIKHVVKDGKVPEPVLTLITKAGAPMMQVDDGKRMFTLADVMYGTRISGASLSPTGRYMLVNYRDTRDGGKNSYTQRLYDVKNGKFLYTLPTSAQWMHKTDRYIVENNDYEHGIHLTAVDPATGHYETLAHHIPEGDYMLSPSDDYLLYNLVREGAKEDPEIYRVIEPEDRQPGWRDRAYPAIYRFDNQILQPLALGRNSLNVADISRDGSKLLLIEPIRRITARPTTLFSLISLDVNTMKADTIVAADGFISDARFSPDASTIYVIGTPEAFDRVGCILPDNVIPSFYDYQLFAVDAASKHVTPLTREFTPSINSVAMGADGKLYLTTTDRDMYRIYSYDPAKATFTLVDTPINVVNGIDMAVGAPVMAYYGQSDSSPDAVYIYNQRTGKSEMVDAPSSTRLSDVRLGECSDWTFTNPKGETVYARYYLPDNFDPGKKYPLIVNYYGGCTPSTRLFESRYPMHVYSSLGYVCLVINPSGASGFGQDWSSRHVSTAGQGVAEDIIAGTEAFCQEMKFVNPEKIGCIGASYGGFMTQYLQTVTDLFAAAVSHAGISDHTSYWGEGYWGYSYSEVSMGEDLPWTNPDLYVKQSPLYRADKIHTPILFVHGDADTNVPVGESIQMFTALSRLGVDTALVEVSGQNHHITDDSKRKKWQETIFAWFAKYLQDDPSWWEELYPTQNL